MFYKAISNAMSMNWNSLDIWLLAVYYQVEMNNNPFKARKIFLKGLKMNPERRVYNQFFPHDKDFWLEYFRFELKFLEIVKKRKEMMGVVDEEPKEGSENNEEGDDDEEVIVISTNHGIIIDNPKETRAF